MCAGLILGDTGGPLIWPMMAVFFGLVGLLIGCGARSDWRTAVVERIDPSRASAKGSVPMPARWIAVGLVALGIGFLVDSSRLPRIRNAAAYQERYDRLGLQRGDTEKFRQLRKEFLTPKTVSENYGATLLVCGLALPVVFVWRGRRRELLQTRGNVFLYGTLTSLVSGLATAADIFLAAGRGEFPWWADSIGIPLLGLPVVFVFMLSWVAGHSFLTGRQPGRSRGPDFRLIRAWLILELSLVVFFLTWAVLGGDFLAITPRMMWGGFYYAVLRGHVRTGRIIAF